MNIFQQVWIYEIKPLKVNLLFKMCPSAISRNTACFLAHFIQLYWSVSMKNPNRSPKLLSDSPEEAHSRQSADALGRVPNVPHFDVGGGDGEDQAGAVAHWHHVIGVATQRHDLLPSHQVPHLTRPIWDIRRKPLSFWDILLWQCHAHVVILKGTPCKSAMTTFKELCWLTR